MYAYVVNMKPRPYRTDESVDDSIPFHVM